MGKRSLVPDAIETYVSEFSTRETPLQRRLARRRQHCPKCACKSARIKELLSRCWFKRRAFVAPWKSAPSPATVRSPWRRLCPLTASWWLVMSAKNGRALPAATGPKPASPTASSCAWPGRAKRWRRLQREGGAASFDFAFIDADKESIDAYYEACLTLVRPGGLIAVDNVLWHGAVVDSSATDAETEAIRALNRKVRDDSRVEACLLTVGDGILLVRKR